MNGKIKKRNGEIVEFNSEKISAAIRKAYGACGIEVGADKLYLITKQTNDTIDRLFPEQTPSVEDVQNVVERILMEIGDFLVAKAYIIYRYEHTKVREEKHKELVEKIEQNALTITKRNGTTENFSTQKLRKSLTWAIEGLQNVDGDLIVEHAQANLYEGIKTEEISKALVLAARGLIEIEPEYSKVAMRLQFDQIFKQAVGRDNVDYKRYDEQYRQAFVANIRKAVEIGRLDPRMLNYDLEAISRNLKPERDDLFVYLGAQTLADRYFIANPETSQVLETPQAFWMRVAMGMALQEEDKVGRTQQFYEVMSTLRFVPSTPTLFHAGTAHPQLSSCYLTTIEDSLSHIFKCIGDNAQMSKWSGGVANDWTNLRATGAFIKGTGVSSQGVVPFLKVANDTTVAINRSGRRRGATCAYLETWHYDIEDFLELKKNTGDDRRRTHDMNTANWIPDLFMKRVIGDQNWTLFSPEEVPDLHHIYGREFEQRYEHYEKLAREGKIHLHKTIKAKDLWKKMIVMLFETGHPWMTWKDPSNVRSPQDHVGVVHCSNLCTEITLNTSAEETAVCNLGSINLSMHIIDGKLDEALLANTTNVAMRMLDNVIDINFYPTIEGQNSNLRHRPVGLGVMGFQDALYMQNINFDSDECVTFADYCQEVVAYHAILASSELAKERGTYKSYKGSKWDRGIFPQDTLDLLEQERGEKILVSRTARLDWTPVREHVKQWGMRNSNCMALAPTATISNIAGCYPTIEPIYKNVYVKSNMSGEFIIVNRYLVEDLKKAGLWSRELLEQIKGNDGNINDLAVIPQALRDKYKEVFDIDYEWIVKAAAHRGKWIDQSQSLNLFIKGTSGKIISDMYQYAWKMGLKTTYYLRSLGATAVEKSTIDLAKQKDMSTVKKEETINVEPRPIVEPQVNVAPAPVAAPQPIVEPERVPSIAAEVATAPVTIMSTSLKLCRIDDPNCESCQ